MGNQQKKMTNDEKNSNVIKSNITNQVLDGDLTYSSTSDSLVKSSTSYETVDSEYDNDS